MGTTDAQPGREAPAPIARPAAPYTPAPRAHAPQKSPPAPVTVPPATPTSDQPAAGATQVPARLDFAAEYEKAYRVLWTVAAGVLGSPGGAEDVVQEAACLALAKQDQFTPGTNFAAWMAQMVRFVALNQVRKESRNRAAPLDLTDAAAHQPLPNRGGGGGGAKNGSPAGDPGLTLGRRGELPPDQRSLDDDLVRALAGLAETARACLLLRTLEGLDYEEIGRVLGIPEGTAMSHVHRSRMRLREQLLKREPRPGRQDTTTTTTGKGPET